MCVAHVLTSSSSSLSRALFSSVYDEIDASEKTLKQQLDSDRKDRSAEVMASEAEKLRKLFYN